MGKKRAANGGVSKTQTIKDALAKDPNASPKQLSADLTAQGYDVSPGYVSTIKTTLKSEGKSSTKKAAQPKVAAVPASASDNGSGVNKSQAIKDALAKDPNASPRQLATELTARGIQVTPTYVSTIKTNLKAQSKDKRRGRTAATSATKATPTVASSEAGNGETTLDVNALVRAKSLVDQVGGVEKAQQLLAVLKKLQ